MSKPHRTTLGELFSEGSRRLWAVKEREGLTVRGLRDRIGEGADVSRWLYGDTTPPARAMARIEELFAIPAPAWFRAPKKAFTPPALRAA